MARLPQLTTVIAVALSLSSCSIVSSPGSDGTFELLIIHNNDMHARFEQTSQLSGACTTADRDAGKCYGGFPRVATVVKEARKAAASGQGPPVLYLNAGDTYTGTAWFTIYKWKIAAEFLNALEPDAVSLGNHEFDNGISGLIPYIANLSCPTLAANLILDDEPELKAQEKLRNSVVFDINGVKIGVIGYLTPDTKVLSSKNNVKYIDEVTAIKDEVKKLNGEGVNILIALGHSGFLTDLKIAQEVNSIDLVIGGHTNTFLWNGKAPDSETPQGPYPKLVKQSSGREVPVVQAYAYTKYLGQLKIVFDSNGEIIGFNGSPILLNNSFPRDPDVVKIVEKYRENVMKVSEISVGSTAVLLDGSSCRLRECNMGNLITDALVYKYASDYQGVGWTDAPIAVMQGGGIRATINHVNDESDITQGDLLTVMPFDDRAVKVAMSGSDIRKMLEHSVAEYNVIRAPGQFLQFSGMKVEYDFQKKSGERVLRAQILCGDCILPEYSMLNDSAVYNILINGFLSMGGDGFSVFVDKPQDYLNFNDLSATIEYINKTSPIFPAIEGRIIIHNEMAISSAYTKTFSLTMLSCFIIVRIFI
ncbi:protein 5NUC-like isoform X9 [Leptidea sinapis]|uniref:protein 5NUC-like isoform X7 n=1 Tax=Leptidea sinapis TaxID=189913 RepID=UPI0021C2C701|nr:protein 5NUC-like isoform X7 [Leptidea sinapis]XP_050665748.1 protein 5NUC-like isoform X8 [Leptidea sinapis]XP_050665749.1 protein 5NUC-like isoform X9 [Leptidea sinapis]